MDKRDTFQVLTELHELIKSWAYLSVEEVVINIGEYADDLFDEFDSDEDDVSHLGCPSYPNCDIDPLGCRHVHGDNVEEYGHRD